MGRYTDLVDQLEEQRVLDRGPRHDTTAIAPRPAPIRLGGPFGKTFAELQRRCPDYIETPDWHQAVDDGRRFLGQWGKQAEALGWTARDLFGLAPVGTDKPAATYRRLSRYDLTGLIWLLRGRPVVAMTDLTAAIRHPSGSITTYRKLNKPGLGPLGDLLEDFRP